jgi:Na+/melibiose symporter-like transporter
MTYGQTSFSSLSLLYFFSVVLVGNLSDRAKGRFRRKPYILIFGPMFAVGVFFKIAALTTRSAAGYYYVFFFLLQMMGSSGFQTALAAWGQELARTNEERSQLFTVATFTGLIISFVVYLRFRALYNYACMFTHHSYGF